MIRCIEKDQTGDTTLTSQADGRLIVFSDDWGRHPSSCQHLVRQLLPEVGTTWVNTIGMRPPRLDWLTVRRGAGKFAGWLTLTSGNGSTVGKVELPTGLSVIDAKMWPWMTRRHDRWLNRHLLTRQLSAAAHDAVAITTIPIVADLVDQLPTRRWVYYCVDDFSVWPGLDGKTLGRMEDELLPKMDVVIAASEALAAGIAARGYHAEVLTHGVDLDFWQSPSPNDAECLATRGSPLASALSPTVLFWGVVDRRLNADWVLGLADAMTCGTIVLAGPQQDPDPLLRNHQRISLPGAIPFDDLPALAQQAAVLIMPYADLPVTRAMQPLKLKEYLATRRPVVASSLPAVREWSDCLEMVDSEQGFVAAVKVVLAQSGTSESAHADRRSERLSLESWGSKASQFLAWMAEPAN